MFDFLNQNWVGAVFGIAGFLVGIIGIALYVSSKIGARPTCQINSLKLIGSTHQQLPSKVSIKYNQEKVNSLSRTTVIFWNSGNKTIKRNQIIANDPLRFEFTGSGKILEANIIAAARKVNDWKISLSDEAKSILLSFDFIDPNDGVKIELLHTFSVLDPDARGTIQGIPKGIKNLSTKPTSRIMLQIKQAFNDRWALFNFVKYFGIAGIIIGLLPDPLFSLISNFVLFGDQDISPRIPARYGMILMGITYTFLGLYGIYKFKRKYPKLFELKEVQSDVLSDLSSGK